MLHRVKRPHAPRPAEGAAPHRAARARDALTAMADEFGPLLQDELTRIAKARDAWRAGASHALDVAAHDLKGLAATIGAPMVGRVAASLERLLAGGHPPPSLVEAHVDAMMAMVREGAADGRDPRGSTLATALERAVGRSLAARLPQAA